MRMLNHTNIVRFFAIEEEARCWYTTTANTTTNTTITTTITFDEPVCFYGDDSRLGRVCTGDPE